VKCIQETAYTEKDSEKGKVCVSGPLIRSRLKLNMSGSHVAGAIAAGAEFASSAICCVKHRLHVPLQAWSGPEGSRKLRFPEFMKTAQEVLLVLISIRG